MEKEMGNRIAKLRGARSQQEVADAIGVRRETVKQWENAERQIKAGDLLKLADYFGVSTDYLVGKSEIQTADESTRCVCEATGLSEKAAMKIMEINSDYVSGEGSGIISKIIEANAFDDFLFEMLNFSSITDCVSILLSNTEDSGEITKDDLLWSHYGSFASAKRGLILQKYTVAASFDFLVDELFGYSKILPKISSRASEESSRTLHNELPECKRYDIIRRACEKIYGGK